MALSNKNIVITPNIGAAADPKIVFSGADASTTAQNITITAYPTSNGTLSFDGSTGQLFSVTNSMTGTIFSVNDVSGMPSIEVLDNGLVKIGQYSGNLVLGSGTDTGLAKLQVTGAFSATGTASTGALAVTGALSATGLGTISVTSGTIITSGSHLKLENPTGGQSSLAFTFAGVPKGLIRLDSSGNFCFGSVNNNYYWGNDLGSSSVSFQLATLNVNGTLQQAGNQVLHAGNYNSYAPTLTGTGASGSWGINVTGNAGSASNITNNGTVTLATATESNSIYITAPSYSTDTPVKLLNFDWYSNIFSIGNIRSSGTGTNGFGVYYTTGGVRTEIARFSTAGSFTASGNVTAYSDRRIKTNIQVIPNALDKVRKLNGYTFDRTDIDLPRQTGVIAQELLEVLPEAVTGSEENHYAVAYGNMAGLFIEAIKEQQGIIDSQEERIARLEALINKLID